MDEVDLVVDSLQGNLFNFGNPADRHLVDD
jgi:hypothetical protein